MHLALKVAKDSYSTSVCRRQIPTIPLISDLSKTERERVEKSVDGEC